ncbi:MAG: hypothetical protein ABW321_02115 [Polyangiales bacterium]
MIRALGCASVMLGALGCAGATPSTQQPISRAPTAELEVHVAERMLLIAPRAGDETRAAAGLTQRVLRRIGTVSTLLFTADEVLASSPSSANVVLRSREREARLAARTLGHGAIRLQLLGMPGRALEQLGGLSELSAQAWTTPTRMRAPAAPEDAAWREAKGKLPVAARNLQASIVRALKQGPTLVAFPDPFEGRPDQRAAGLITLLAAHEHMRGRSAPWPRLLAYTQHGRRQYGANVHAALEPPPYSFMPLCLRLTSQERERKREALAAYATPSQGIHASAAEIECFSANTPVDVATMHLSVRAPADG